jgi:hypothetical protein
MFDYGKIKNLKVYGSVNPPAFDEKRFNEYRIKSFITTSDSDPFSTIEDINFFYNNVRDKSAITFLNMKNYNHLDYLWAPDAKDDLYKNIILFIK